VSQFRANGEVPRRLYPSVEAGGVSLPVPPFTFVAVLCALLVCGLYCARLWQKSGNSEVEVASA
jgi:hypothetical protein